MARQPRLAWKAAFIALLTALTTATGPCVPVRADAPAEAARRGPVQAPDPSALFDRALGQLIYGVPDDQSGMLSAIRGHELARTLYGFNDEVLNTQPFNGTGRLHFTHLPGSGAFSGADDYHLVNYQRFDADPIRDPERYGVRTDGSQARAFFTGGFNAPYTYPDLNNLALAAATPDGTLITPSFHREWLFGSLAPTNPNWSTPAGKYLTLRPRPADMGPNFPLPGDLGGDVKNRPFLPGGNDSIWIDLGFPVRTAPSGRRFKPLFAFYVEDLDGRVPSPAPAGVGAPARTPWLWDRSEESQYAVPSDDPEAPPDGPAVPFPTFDRRGDRFGNPGLPVPRFSDLRTPGLAADDPEVDWRGFHALSIVAQGIDREPPDAGERTALNRLVGALQRQLDLAPRLPSYPLREPYVTPEQRAQAMLALIARQQLAEDVYRRLLVVTGTPPVPAGSLANPPDGSLAPRRWLAQLAVNIVDYIDEDEIATPFNFYSTVLDAVGNVGQGTTTPSGDNLPRNWVFGVELPRVVINEVLTEFALPPQEPASVKVWAELHTPRRQSSQPAEQPIDTPVALFASTGAGAGYSTYRIEVARSDARQGTPLIARPDNVLGSFADVASVAEFSPTLGTVGDPDQPIPAVIDPDTYLIVGPSSGGGQDAQQTIHPTQTRPPGTPWYRTNDMQFDGDDPAAAITVVLRRLANPHLPPDSRPVVDGTLNAFYNPYVTIDYLAGIGLGGNQSVGKLQPLAAHPNRVQAQTVEQGGGTRHTLGERNQPREQADWLVHLDRGLVSPVELLSVAGVRPHQLTQRFITTPAGEPADHRHRAPWFDEDLAGLAPPRSHRLYRLFELMQTADRSAGVAPRGRVAGKINLNTIWDFDTFRNVLTLSDPRLPPADLRAVWDRLLMLRSPHALGPRPELSAADRPFQSAAVGILPASDPQANGRGVDIDDTIFRAWDAGAGGDQRRLFDLPGEGHPFVRNQLLAEVFDRTTTRSNTYAVWLTTGFFEVADETLQPVKLGAEIGQAQGTQVRHRFFAIVDRTNLQLFGLQGARGRTRVTRFLTRAEPRFGGGVLWPSRQWVRLDALSGLTASERRDATGMGTGEFLPWRIEVGTRLFADVGAHRELVVVTNVDPARNAIEVDFEHPHHPGFEISIPGNPGPQPDFDHRSPLFGDVIVWAARLE